MAIKLMTKVGAEGERNEISWEYEDSKTGAGDGDTIIIPTGIDSIMITLVPSSANCKIQTTTDKLGDVQNDKSSVTWVDWPLGNVTSTVQDSLDPVTAIRQVVNSGTSSKLKVRAQ